MTELEKAINLIEQAGGIVMIAQDFNEESRDGYLKRLEAEETREQAELEQWQVERKKSWNQMAKDFDKMISQIGTSFTDVENMVLGHGFDLDEIENLIHKLY